MAAPPAPAPAGESDGLGSGNSFNSFSTALSAAEQRPAPARGRFVWGLGVVDASSSSSSSSSAPTASAAPAPAPAPASSGGGGGSSVVGNSADLPFSKILMMEIVEQKANLLFSNFPHYQTRKFEGVIAIALIISQSMTAGQLIDVRLNFDGGLNSLEAATKTHIETELERIDMHAVVAKLNLAAELYTDNDGKSQGSKRVRRMDQDPNHPSATVP